MVGSSSFRPSPDPARRDPRRNREIPSSTVNHAGDLRLHEIDDAIIILAAFRIERRLQEHALVVRGAGLHIRRLRAQPYGNAAHGVGKMNAAPDISPFIDRVGKILNQDCPAAATALALAGSIVSACSLWCSSTWNPADIGRAEWLSQTCRKLRRLLVPRSLAKRTRTAFEGVNDCVMVRLIWAIRRQISATSSISTHDPNGI